MVILGEEVVSRLPRLLYLRLPNCINRLIITICGRGGYSTTKLMSPYKVTGALEVVNLEAMSLL